VLNEDKLTSDLDANWAVVAEAIQNILRRENVEKPYEKLKELTRGSIITEDKIKAFIETLDIPEAVKEEMRVISPHNYIGYY
jgi:adenylosuccinate lyase